MNQQLQTVPGSLADTAQNTGKSLAETFVNAEVVILVDVSGSMAEGDARGGRQRYEVALEELAALQKSLPGRIAVMAFSTETVFVPGGQPPYLGASTNLAEALKFAKSADLPGVRFMVISDGEPDNERAALDVAATYTARIDTVFVGPEADTRGQDFLRRLAAAHRGSAQTAARLEALAETARRLLTSG